MSDTDPESASESSYAGDNEGGDLAAQIGSVAQASAQAAQTATKATAVPNATLKSVQTYLNAHGYAFPALTVDGLDGPKTQAAVSAFEKAMGLTVDGHAGPQVYAAMGLGAAAPPMPAAYTPIGATPAAPAPTPKPAPAPAKPAPVTVNVLAAKGTNWALWGGLAAGAAVLAGLAKKLGGV